MPRGKKTTINNEEVKEIVTTTPRKRVKIERDLEVKVMNLCPGSFYHIDDKTQGYYVFREYGDFDYITIDELMRMRNKTPKVFNDFWILITDVESDDIQLEDVLTYLQLEKLYKDFMNIEKIDDMLIKDKFEKFESMMDNMNSSVFNKVVERAVELFKEKKFSDRWKMDTIEKKIDKPYLFSDISKAMS